MTTATSRDFNQDTSAAKKQAAHGPVIITDRGKPAHVLTTIEDYEKLTVNTRSFLSIIAHEVGDDFDFDIPKLSNPSARDFEFE
jgi:prevent-host-death family protein